MIELAIKIAIAACIAGIVALVLGGFLGIMFNEQREPRWSADVDEHGDVASTRIIGIEPCPACGTFQVARLPDDWQQRVELAGMAIPIIGCGNPWHYANMVQHGD